MKTLSMTALGVATAALLFVGCNEAKNAAPVAQEQTQVPVPSISEEELGLRKTSIDHEQNVEGSKTKYSDSYPGSGYKIKRAFQDAPPMIPHDTEGMLPITIHDNQCIACHMPEVAADMGATPIPSSHYTNFRPQHKLLEGEKFVKSIDNMKNEVSIKKQETLAGARFNCSQCHAPQSDGQLVENSFEPDFVAVDGAEKTAWDGDRLLKGLNTVGDVSFVTEDDLENSDSKAGVLEDSHGH
ncbi:MAG: nitrate reductase cytochrome c-type subunit [Sulfurimonas sp.]|jgi:cytochrome c-type protein NapB|nr:nitrate reductase cytochrome c-type subunit [Sulfurimonas sp.]